MRNVGSINWGVRDWSKLRFEVAYFAIRGIGQTGVLIFGASEESALRLYVWEKLGSRARVNVVCREG